MINKQKLYSIALVSAAMILMMVSIAGAAPFAYITNEKSGDVSVIDTATNTVTATVPLEDKVPLGVAVTPDGTNVYVGKVYNNSVSVINTTTNTVIDEATIPLLGGTLGVAINPNGTEAYVTCGWDSQNIAVINTTNNTVINGWGEVAPFLTGIVAAPDGTKLYTASFTNDAVSVINITSRTIEDTVNVGMYPYAITITPDGTKVYVANSGNSNVSSNDYPINPITIRDNNNVPGTVSVINTTTNTVATNVIVGLDPYGIAVTPDGTKVYVTNSGSNNVSIIDTATNNVTATVPVGLNPFGVGVTPDGTKVYVANYGDNTVSVINTATNTVIATVPVGNGPAAFGIFMETDRPALNITKVVNPTTYNTAGQVLTYTYNITNSGNVNITEPITVNDNKISGGQLTIGTSGNLLAPGQSVIGHAAYSVTQADVDNGSVTNLANATCSYNTKLVSSNNTSVTISAIQNPALKIVSLVDPKVYFAVGDLLDYDYTVTNTGNVDISGPITIRDDMFGSKQISHNGLAPGQSVMGKASHLVSSPDIYAGFISNSAYATGSFGNKEVTSNSDTATTRFFGPNSNLYPTIYYS